MDPVARLAELMRAVSRHREVIEELRRSGFRARADLHELELKSVYGQIRKHCREQSLLVPRDVPSDSGG